MKLNYLVAGCIAVASLASCTKSFEDNNQNLNSPTTAPSTNLLGFALEDYAAGLYDVWGNMNEPETYGGHLGKIQYIDEARYVFRGSVVQSDWTYSYRDMKNLQLVYNAALKSGQVNQQAVALTFQSFIGQIATDTWRDLPFSDALKGDSGVITPKYDKQEDIYPVLLANLKKANDLFAQGTIDELGAGDFLYNGDVAKWRKFCNSIRLRIAIRISKVDPATAKSVIEEIAGNPSQNPVFTSNDDNAFFNWPGGKPYNEPWASDKLDNSRDDHAVSDVLVITLQNLSDPRISVYAKLASDDVYRGVGIGIPDQDRLPSLGLYSRIGARFRENKQGFTPFMRYAEVEFILAEAAANGWNVGVTVENAYNKGIQASMEENEVAGGDVTTYINSANVKYNGDVTKINLQKWIALFKDGHEAWAESRRTDVPSLPAAKGSPYPGHNRAPFRYPYPDNEIKLNGGNSAASVAQLKDNFWGQQMWWDVRKNVQ